MELGTDLNPLPAKQNQVPVVSPKNSLTSADWQAWIKETFIYTVIPIALIFVQTLQSAFMAHGGFPNSQDLTLAAGAAYGTFIASLINLLSKYKAGV